MTVPLASFKIGGEACLDETEFLALVQFRPADERWELIDGVPVEAMNPATKIHNRIAANLERALNRHFESSRPELDALREAPLAVETERQFRPIADLAVIPVNATENVESNAYFFDRFYLAAEVLSASNAPSQINRMRAFYAASPDCLYVLILSKTDMAIEIWAKSQDWQGRVLRSADDVIELPEFGFSCCLGDLYRGTPVT